MNARETLEGNREHLGRRVQLHRARAERDHRTVQGDVPGREPAEVPQHLGLAVVTVKHRVVEDGIGAKHRASLRHGRAEASSESTDSTSAPGANPASTSAMTSEVVVSSTEIPDPPLVDLAQVDPPRPHPFVDRGRTARSGRAPERDLHRQRVEKGLGLRLEAEPREPFAEHERHAVHTRRAIRESPSGPW